MVFAGGTKIEQCECGEDTLVGLFLPAIKSKANVLDTIINLTIRLMVVTKAMIVLYKDIATDSNEQILVLVLVVVVLAERVQSQGISSS